MSFDQSLATLARRVRQFIQRSYDALGESPHRVPGEPGHHRQEADFNQLALDLFAAQFQQNAPYRALCEARDLVPGRLDNWRQVPAVPANAFKDAEFTSLAPSSRTATFHSSGTTGRRPSRHFHNHESLALYQTSLWPWFERHLLQGHSNGPRPLLLFLSPSPAEAPHSSLVYMFEAIRRRMELNGALYLGGAATDEAWTLKPALAIQALESALSQGRPVLLLGTAFSFVHLLDLLDGQRRQLRLAPGSRAMETGGYKGRSRTLPKRELHRLITDRLDIPPENIVCEYGMSELSSQAYAGPDGRFRFPPWARQTLISPETGEEAADGEPGLIRVLDLANVWSVAALQTEDLGVARGHGFELVGRSQLAEPRGCSLMAR